MTSRTFVLVHDAARRNAVEAVQNAPHGYRVTVKPSTRSLDQNAKLHALLTEVATKAKYMGRTLDMLQWKVIFISGHAIATGQQAEIVPGLEGEFINIRESSAQMSVSRMTSLIDYIHAWAAMNNVILGDDIAP